LTTANRVFAQRESILGSAGGALAAGRLRFLRFQALDCVP
jgi:hypothetical protein